MATLQVDPADYSATKQKAVADAKKMQAFIIKECEDTGQVPPPYLLSELIGKGSFGRVYKAIGTGRPEFVAVKIISIDEGDSLAPGAADTFKDILREVDTLKLLSNSGATNINTVIDTLLVGHSMWMVTEYCAGGSVATLMKPTGFLAEKWIIPILREVAEGISWVHKQGIIHRDIKCANVLVTEEGGVQLCDFGVAGIVETKTDKRRTVTGTLQWMAPEFFDSRVSYGTEVDIWAFGSMTYEAATGAPPNAANITDISQFGSYLKSNCPRLEGDQYSAELKDLVSCCMIQSPARRPAIEQLRKHPYIFNTEKIYPTESLSNLVHAYKLWEIQGGSRRSLFSAGGAQGHLSSESSFSDTWNFDDVPESNHLAFDSDAKKVHDAYGSRVNFPAHRPGRQARSRLPSDTKPLRVPLERLFDPNTISNYKDNTRAFYSKTGRTSVSSTDSGGIQLDDRGAQESDIASPVAYGAAVQSLPQQALDEETIHLMASNDAQADLKKTMSDATRSRRPSTREWTFPVTVPASPTLDTNQLHSANDHSASDSKPKQKHAYAPSTLAGVNSVGKIDHNVQRNRLSSVSLIDLDASLPNLPTHVSHSSTASTDSANSVSTSSSLDHGPFHLERFLEARHPPATYRPPSIFAPDVNASSAELHVSSESSQASSTTRANNAVSVPSDHGSNNQHGAKSSTRSRRESSVYVSENSSFFKSPSVTPPNDVVADEDGVQDSESGSGIDSKAGGTLEDLDATPRPRIERLTESSLKLIFPPKPPPPSASVMEGDATDEEVKSELRRLATNCSAHFQFMGEMLEVRAPWASTHGIPAYPGPDLDPYLSRPRGSSTTVSEPTSEQLGETEPHSLIIHGVCESGLRTGNRPRLPLYPELITEAVREGCTSEIPEDNRAQNEHNEYAQQECSLEQPLRKRQQERLT